MSLGEDTIPETHSPTSMTNPPLSGKLALVTGASAGIGAASARALSGAGAHVVCCARRADALKSVVSECSSAEALTLDLPLQQRGEQVVGRRRAALVEGFLEVSVHALARVHA